jgi:hypothetical protein
MRDTSELVKRLHNITLHKENGLIGGQRDATSRATYWFISETCFIVDPLSDSLSASSMQASDHGYPHTEQSR